MNDEFYDQAEDERFQERVDEGRFYDVVHFRTKGEGCEHCKHYQRENIHEGYCNSKGDGTMKDNICSSYQPKGE